MAAAAENPCRREGNCRRFSKKVFIPLTLFAATIAIGTFRAGPGPAWRSFMSRRRKVLAPAERGPLGRMPGSFSSASVTSPNGFPEAGEFPARRVIRGTLDYSRGDEVANSFWKKPDSSSPNPPPGANPGVMRTRRMAGLKDSNRRSGFDAGKRQQRANA